VKSGTANLEGKKKGQNENAKTNTYRINVKLDFRNSSNPGKKEED